MDVGWSSFREKPVKIHAQSTRQYPGARKRPFLKASVIFFRRLGAQNIWAVDRKSPLGATPPGLNPNKFSFWGAPLCSTLGFAHKNGDPDSAPGRLCLVLTIGI